MTVARFEEKYGLKEHHLSSHITLKAALERRHAVYYNKGSGVQQVNESYFTRRIEFRHKVVEYCHSFYYFLEEYYTTSDIAREFSKMVGNSLSSCSEFFSNSLFRHKETTILDYRVSFLVRWFHRFCKKIERNLRVIYLEFNVEYILDRRMEMAG